MSKSHTSDRSNSTILSFRRFAYVAQNSSSPLWNSVTQGTAFPVDQTKQQKASSCGVNHHSSTDCGPERVLERYTNAGMFDYSALLRPTCGLL